MREHRVNATRAVLIASPFIVQTPGGTFTSAFLRADSDIGPVWYQTTLVLLPFLFILLPPTLLAAAWGRWILRPRSAPAGRP